MKYAVKSRGILGDRYCPHRPLARNCLNYSKARAPQAPFTRLKVTTSNIARQRPRRTKAFCCCFRADCASEREKIASKSEQVDSNVASRRWGSNSTPNCLFIFHLFSVNVVRNCCVAHSCLTTMRTDECMYFSYTHTCIME